MSADVVFYTPYARGMAAVTETKVAEARRSIARRTSDTGWIEFADADNHPAYLRGIAHALKAKLERPDVLIYLRRQPSSQRLQAWVCGTLKELQDIKRGFGDMSPSLP